MKTFSLLIGLSLIATRLAFGAEGAPREAVILGVKGAVTVQPAAGPAGAALVGAKLQSGARLVTGVGSQVTVRFYEGIVTVIQQGSELRIQNLAAISENGVVTKETTALDLRSGSLLATLDPAKKLITDFKVRTPKGVATAHGTVFSVIVSQDQSNASVTTMTGIVTYVTDQGTFTVALGQVTSGSGVMTVSQAIAANPALAQVFIEAATNVAAAVGQGSISNSTQSPEHVNTVLAAVTEIAAQAAPNQAAEIARNVLTAAAPALNANTGAAQVIAQAAVQGVAKVDPALAASASNEVSQAVTTAANNNAVPADLAAVQNAAAQGANGGAVSSPGSANPILPRLDQTQVIVSPSRS
jgi:hypothetical protein